MKVLEVIKGRVGWEKKHFLASPMVVINGRTCRSKVLGGPAIGIVRMLPYDRISLGGQNKVMY